MREDALPLAFAGLAGQVQFVQRQSAREFSSSCPKCGGERHRDGTPPDRFRMFNDGHPLGWCRQCSYLWFPDDGRKPSQAELDQRSERIRQAEAERRQEIERKRAELIASRVWEDYSNALWHSHAHMLAVWAKRGLTEQWVAYYELGYCQERNSLAIPIWQTDWTVANLKHRLLDTSGPRYQHETSGIPASLFVANPALSDLRCPVVLVEGEIKAMVVTIALQPVDRPMAVVGLPGKNPPRDELALLKDSEPIWFIPDPDVMEGDGGNGIIDQLCRERVRIVELPDKVDDLLVKGQMDGQDLRNLMRRAKRPAKAAI